MSEVEADATPEQVEKQHAYYVSGTLATNDLWKPVMKMSEACAKVVDYTTNPPKPDPFHPDSQVANAWVGGGGGGKAAGGGGGGGGGCAIL